MWNSDFISICLLLFFVFSWITFPAWILCFFVKDRENLIQYIFFWFYTGKNVVLIKETIIDVFSVKQSGTVSWIFVNNF